MGEERGWCTDRHVICTAWEGGSAAGQYSADWDLVLESAIGCGTGEMDPWSGGVTSRENGGQ